MQISMGQPSSELPMNRLSDSPLRPERSNGSSSSTGRPSEGHFGSGVLRSAFLAVYQRGEQIWANAAATEVSLPVCMLFFNRQCWPQGLRHMTRLQCRYLLLTWVSC